MKIIYISNVPLSEKIAKDFCFEEVDSQVAKVEYWDMQSAMGLQNYSVIRPEKFGVIIKSRQEFSERLTSLRNENCLFVMLVDYYWSTRFIYRQVKTLAKPTVYFAFGRLPSPPPKKRSAVEIFRKILHSPRWIIGRLMLHLVDSFSPLNFIFSLVFTAGRAAEGSTVCLKEVSVKTPDLENVLEASESPASDQKLCIFLDEYLPYHPDFAILDIPVIHAHPYLDTLNVFFDYLEKKHNFKVVVALHPKADYRGRVFGHRKLVKFQTAELIKNADLVLGHTTTSLGYLSVYRKKAILIYTDEYQELYVDRYMRLMKAFSNEMGIPMLNISHQMDESIFNDLNVDLEAREKYFRNYMCSLDNSVSIKNVDIICRELKKQLEPR